MNGAFVDLRSMKAPFMVLEARDHQGTEAGPVIETPLSGAQTMHDMLVQSRGGVVRVFPAVPAA